MNAIVSCIYFILHWNSAAIIQMPQRENGTRKTGLMQMYFCTPAFVIPIYIHLQWIFETRFSGDVCWKFSTIWNHFFLLFKPWANPIKCRFYRLSATLSLSQAPFHHSPDSCFPFSNISTRNAPAAVMWIDVISSASQCASSRLALLHHI